MATRGQRSPSKVMTIILSSLWTLMKEALTVLTSHHPRGVMCGTVEQDVRSLCLFTLMLSVWLEGAEIAPSVREVWRTAGAALWTCTLTGDL